MIIQSSIGKWSYVFGKLTKDSVMVGGEESDILSRYPPSLIMTNDWRATRTQPQGADERVVSETRRAYGRSGQRAIFRCVQKFLDTNITHER
jgi:hypothetical protein